VVKLVIYPADTLPSYSGAIDVFVFTSPDSKLKRRIQLRRIRKLYSVDVDFLPGRLAVVDYATLHPDYWLYAESNRFAEELCRTFGCREVEEFDYVHAKTFVGESTYLITYMCTMTKHSVTIRDVRRFVCRAGECIPEEEYAYL